MFLLHYDPTLTTIQSILPARARSRYLLRIPPIIRPCFSRSGFVFRDHTLDPHAPDPFHLHELPSEVHPGQSRCAACRRFQAVLPCSEGRPVVEPRSVPISCQTRIVCWFGMPLRPHSQTHLSVWVPTCAHSVTNMQTQSPKITRCQKALSVQLFCRLTGMY